VSVPEHTYVYVAGGRAAVIAEAGTRSDAPDAVSKVHLCRARDTADHWLAELRAGRLPEVGPSDPDPAHDDPDRPAGGVLEAQLTERYE
jgi:hypothetical protein